MPLWKRKGTEEPGGQSEHEGLVLLVQEARRDVDFRRQLALILKQNNFQRSSLLSTMIEQARFEGGSAELMVVLEALKDDRIAERARLLLSAED